MALFGHHRHHKLGERELIVLMALLMSLQAFGIDSMLPALGAIGGDLGATGNERQFVIGAYFLGSGIGAFFPGALPTGSAAARCWAWGLSLMCCSRSPAPLPPRSTG